MKTFRSDFPFYGARDYVHGPTIFETFRARVLEAAGLDEHATFVCKVFRVSQPMHANGLVVVAEAREAGARYGKAAAEMSCVAAGRPWYATLHDVEPSPITRREASREKDLVGEVRVTAPHNGVVALQGLRDNADLFQAVVEAKKQVHLKTLTGDPRSAAIKFRYAYCLDYPCAAEVAPAGTVEVHHEGLRDAGEYLFSLSRLELRLGGFESRFRVCFASKDMKQSLSARERTAT